jgi:hypothetical protein
MTGYVYGSLFFTPIDVPFFGRNDVGDPRHRGDGSAGSAVLAFDPRGRSSPALAIATRTGGIITHAYLPVRCSCARWNSPP